MKIITKAVLDMETMTSVSVESYDYDGPVDKCCGPSGAEEQTQAQQESLANQLAADFGSRFATQTSMLNQLNQSLSPIISKGPSQQGMSPQELAAFNTQAINSAGAAARNARQAAGNFSAGQGGGASSGLQSGIQKQINASIDSSVANNLSNQQLGITEANYNQGRQNYQAGLSALLSTAGISNPGEFSGQAGQGYSQSFNEANTINQQKNQVGADIAGFATSLAGNIVPGLSALSGVFGGGGTGGTGVTAGAGGTNGNPYFTEDTD